MNSYVQKKRIFYGQNWPEFVKESLVDRQTPEISHGIPYMQ